MPTFPLWPTWFAAAGLFGALGVGTVVAVAVIAVVSVTAGLDIAKPQDESVANLVGTLIQDAALVVVAIGLAWTVARPRLWHFGLRRARLLSTVGWSVLGLVVFYLAAAGYSALVGSAEEQTILSDLGVGDSATRLALAAMLVVVVAPVVEELFFRGFFYRSLRGRLPVWAAALITGAVFGAIHATTGIDAVPILFVFGTILCLVYERTGTLYSAIAMHAVNNTLAFGVGSGHWTLSLALGGAVIAGCVVAPLLTSSAAEEPVSLAPA